jgi:hypothetical protein
MLRTSRTCFPACLVILGCVSAPLTLQVFHGAREAPDGNPGSSHPTLYFSRCEEEIAGQRVWLSTGIHTGYSHVAHAAGAWRLSDTTYAHLSGMAVRRDAVEQALMVLRTVRLEQ